jgi:hypothetical protein
MLLAIQLHQVRPAVGCLLRARLHVSAGERSLDFRF